MLVFDAKAIKLRISFYYTVENDCENQEIFNNFLRNVKVLGLIKSKREVVLQIEINKEYRTKTMLILENDINV